MCGIIGITGVKGVVKELYQGMITLQHRGQDACGIVTFDNKFLLKKGNGLVKEVFNKKHLQRLCGSSGIGHVRYATVGDGDVEDIQPAFLDGRFFISMAHNGNLTNFADLKRRFKTIRSGCDLEAILKVFYNEFPRGIDFTSNEAIDAVFDTVKKVMEICKGSYSVITHIPGLGMLGFKDPFGIKPLIFGRKQTAEGPAYAFASEDISFQLPLGYDLIKDLEPGSAILVTESGAVVEKKIIPSWISFPCIFEWIYFAMGCSSLLGVSASEYRYQQGKELAYEYTKLKYPTGDKVICTEIPSASERGAAGFSEAIGIKYRKVFIRNNYVGRGFILPDKESRTNNAMLKLPIDFSVLRDVEYLILVDDSIVRGDTSKAVIERIRKETAKRGFPLKEIYFLSMAPPNKFPCVYGIDMSVDKELIASRAANIEEIRDYIGVDHLIYQKREVLGKILAKLVGKEGVTFCDACFSGNYPTGITKEDIERIKQERIRDKGCEY